jgi:hypothetical protein
MECCKCFYQITLSDMNEGNYLTPISDKLYCNTCFDQLDDIFYCEK